MPELSRFYGIIIRMYVEKGERHNRPHFHAHYQGQSAIYAIDDSITRMAGDIPAKEERLVLAWAELHRLELINDWNALLHGRMHMKIPPLQ
jgi:hypothetical protein